jgi:hypothetical protein
MHAAAAEKRGVIRHCRRVKANRGSAFQPTLRIAGLPITLCSLVQCAVEETPRSEPGGSDAMARRSGDLDSSAIGRQLVSICSPDTSGQARVTRLDHPTHGP